MANKGSAGRPHGGDLFRDEVNSVLADLQSLAEELTPGHPVPRERPDAETSPDLARPAVPVASGQTATAPAAPVAFEDAATALATPVPAAEAATAPPAPVPAEEAATAPPTPVPAEEVATALSPASEVLPSTWVATGPPAGQPPPMRSEDAEPPTAGPATGAAPGAGAGPVEAPMPAPLAEPPPTSPAPPEFFAAPPLTAHPLLPPLPLPTGPASAPPPPPPPLPVPPATRETASEFPLRQNWPPRPPAPPPVFREAAPGWRPQAAEPATALPTPELAVEPAAEPVVGEPSADHAIPEEVSAAEEETAGRPATPGASVGTPAPNEEGRPGSTDAGAVETQRPPSPAPDAVLTRPAPTAAAEAVATARAEGHGLTLPAARDERSRSWVPRRAATTTVIASGFPPEGPRPGLLPSAGAAETTLVSNQPWTLAAAMAPLVPLTPPPARPGGPPHVDTAGADVTATRARAGGPPTALIAVGIVVVLLIAAGILIIRLHLLHG